MKAKLYFTLILIFSLVMPVWAKRDLTLEIVYPKNNSVINAKSSFIIGHSAPKSTVFINDTKINTEKNGGFVYVITLNEGINTFNIKSTKKNAQKNLVLQVNVPEKQKSSYKPAEIQTLSAVAEVITDNAVVRDNPDQNRLTPLPIGTLLEITGKLGNAYRYKYSDKVSGWISQKDIKLIDADANSPISIAPPTLEEKNNSISVKIPISNKIPFLISEKEPNKMDLTFFNTNSQNEIKDFGISNSILALSQANTSSKNSLTFSITTPLSHFWGYKYYYDGENFVLEFKKPSATDKKHPLKNKIICIDPGHGGEELGAVGITGIPEKEINLKISKYLKKYLQKSGAKVIMTRDKDTYVGLYERVEFAVANNADVLLSIHNNALPDGHNPCKEHGTSTYFYHLQSRPLAEVIRKNLVNSLQFNDLGTNPASFVLTRPADFPAALAEVGFMISPDEYNLLITKKYQKKSAKALNKALIEVFATK